MKLIWTILSTVLLIALGITGIIVFETTVHPGSDQREKIGSVVFGVVAVLAIALWSWHFAAGRPKKKSGKRGG